MEILTSRYTCDRNINKTDYVHDIGVMAYGNITPMIRSIKNRIVTQIDFRD